jgi:hypothetical protein
MCHVFTIQGYTILLSLQAHDKQCMDISEMATLNELAGHMFETPGLNLYK